MEQVDEMTGIPWGHTDAQVNRRPATAEDFSNGQLPEHGEVYFVTPKAKRCSRCGETKPVSEFNRANKRDGYQDWCKACKAAYARDQARKKRAAEASAGSVETEKEEKPTEKRCSRCGEIKPNTEFGRNKRKADGLQGWCKACQRQYEREVRKQRRAAKAPEVETVSVETEKVEEPAVVEKTQRCTVCGQVKPLSEFHRRGERGWHCACRDCENAASRRRRRERRERKREEANLELGVSLKLIDEALAASSASLKDKIIKKLRDWLLFNRDQKRGG
jgi:ribosomal protein S27AE